MNARSYIVMWVVAGTLGVAVAGSDAPTTFKGTIKSVGAQMLVLSSDSEQHQFKVAPDAKITIDDKEASFSDLMPGFKAEVTAEKAEDGTMVASSIRAESAGWVPPDEGPR